jgi:single-strand DNA-binding protein
MDPELTDFGNGACVARVSLAIRGKRRTPTDDQPFGDEAFVPQADEDAATTWVDVEAWNDEARQLCDHVRKGRQIQVTGRLKENTWVDKQTGQKRSRIKVSAYSFAFVAPYAPGGTAAGGQTSAGDPYYARQGGSPSPPPPGAYNNASPAPSPPPANPNPAAASEKDDLWRDLIENPSAWWDNRPRKAEPGGNPRYPDFKHKESQTPLWIESRDTPAWAAQALANGLGGSSGVTAAGVGAAGVAAVNDASAAFGDPYYEGDAYNATRSDAAPDYSQPYDAAPPGGGDPYYENNQGGQQQGGYEPAAFEDDEPPF